MLLVLGHSKTGNISLYCLSLVQRSSLTGHSFPKYQHADRNRTSLNRFTQVTKRQTWNSGQGVSRGDIEQGKTIHDRIERAPIIKTLAQLRLQSKLHQHYKQPYWANQLLFMQCPVHEGDCTLLSHETMKTLGSLVVVVVVLGAGFWSNIEQNNGTSEKEHPP